MTNDESEQPAKTAAAPSLAELGWAPAMMPVDLAEKDPSLKPARVASVYAARVDVWTENGPRLASLRGRVLRESADSRIEGGIAVGDWVLVRPVAPNNDEVVVEAILPRRTVFLRQAAGERAEPQSIAANVDRVFVVTDVDRDFNIRRLERYLLAIAAGGAEAQVVLTKADLIDEETLVPILEEANKVAPTLVTSAKSGVGLDDLRGRITNGMTVALVGSSGVGKSALVNRLLGHDAQLEGAVREYDGRGRHTTTKRSLFLLPGGGLLIDTPGMRELKPWLPDGMPTTAASDSPEAADAFEDIAAAIDQCRYRDCTHETEPGCGVHAALERGDLTGDRVDAWKKLVKESAVLAPRQATFAAVETKRRAKSMQTALRKRLKEKG